MSSGSSGWKPTVVFVDERNRKVADDLAEVAGPKRRTSMVA